MPIYVYQHPKSEEYIEVFQSMKEDHIYIDADGLKWNRVFLSPNAAIDIDVDPFSRQQFLDKAKNAGTMGELWDRSSDLSAQRAEKTDGVDPFKKKYFKNYSTRRKGAKHYLDDH